jgi:hypothetical protein
MNMMIQMCKCGCWWEMVLYYHKNPSLSSFAVCFKRRSWQGSGLVGAGMDQIVRLKGKATMIIVLIE